MTQSPLLIVESSSFAIEAGEDAQTNPGIYGKALARWLAARLRTAGVQASDPIAEDFGWVVPVAGHPHALFVACASGDEAGQWKAFVFAEGGLAARLLGKDTRAESVASLFATLRGVLDSAPDIRGMVEEPS